MTTRSTISLFVISLIATAPIATADDVPNWATEKLLAPWYVAFNAHDAEAIADMYTSDAKIGDAQGRSQIIASFKSTWADGDITCAGKYDGFQIVGDLATGWGHDSCSQAPESGGDSETINSRWLAVYERQDDGTWLCSRDISEQSDD